MDGYLANIGNFIWKNKETLLTKIENHTILDRLKKRESEIKN